ncbi:ribosomal protein L1 [Rhodotorula diobovata]|uniref:Ribosomal protein L1 n=1 Tax=Rhodotorula diobovata TaxID=5288 RepID=A0A5C5FQG5_9BASI|nr:ribosomal protein L1 [Rhodotorula diobovata]
MSAIATVTSTSSSSQAPPPLWKPASVAPRALPALPALDDLPVSQTQCDKAMNALVKHVDKVQKKRDDEDLLGEQDEKVFLVVGLKQAPKREVHKPVRIAVPHPVLNPRVQPVTLFVKDPQRFYKDLLAELKVGFITRVVGLDKLRTKHKTFEAKRQLLKEGELFLVDDRVTVEVGKCLGKMWRDAKKQPIPVALQRKDLKAELERAVASTYMNVTTGTSLSIKLGSTTQLTAAELLSNLRAVLPHIATRIPQAPSTFSNVQSLHLKSSTSVALPIYNAALSTRFDPVEEGDEVRAARDLAQRRKEEERRRREEREAEKERRRLERAATREGKGRAEKREREDEDGEGAEAGGEEAPVAEAAPPAAEEDKVDEAPKPKAKKAKKESTTSPAATKEDKKAAKPKKAAAAKKAKA